MTDERYVVVDGRRWRATDPTIPAPLRQELVVELMSARRAVAAARRTGDDEAETMARRRVQDAKVALGERGAPWWEPPSDAGQRARVMAAMLTLLRARRTDSSICPSDVARAVGGERWRRLLPVVRLVAGELAANRVVEVTQRGQPVVVGDVKGPVRVRRGDRLV